MKNQTFKTMLLILLVIGTNITISAQAWQRIGKQFGNTPNSGTTFYSPALAFLKFRGIRLDYLVQT